MTNPVDHKPADDQRVHLWISPRWRRRLELVLGGYLVVGIFALGTVVLGVWQRDLSTLELIAGAAVAAAPLALALLSDRLSAAKVGPIEVSFAEVAAKLDIGVADQFQAFDSIAMSDSLPILQQVIASMRGSQAPRLLGINLHDGQYWWSTRLFLLTALTVDYTATEMVIFVEGGAEARYVGMASRSDVRLGLARQFDGYEIAYRHALDLSLGRNGAVPVPRRRSAEDEVRDLVMAWGGTVQSVLGTPREAGQPQRSESEIKEVVGRPELGIWLAGELDTHAVEWDRLPLTDELRYVIVGQSRPFAALTQQGRLEKVIDRVELATRISQKALEHVIASGRA